MVGMDRLNLLSVALGLACLAGLNLYLTVFATGLAIHFHWIVLAPQYQSLAILGQPIVITISGVLFFCAKNFARHQSKTLVGLAKAKRASFFPSRSDIAVKPAGKTGTCF